MHVLFVDENVLVRQGVQVENFLKNHKEFTFIEEKKILPSVSGYDGFYMALLEKID